jgi:hypothetical protein
MAFRAASKNEVMETFHRQAEDGRQIVVRVTVRWGVTQRSFPLLITYPEIFC